jgi:hypothetical protein
MISKHTTGVTEEELKHRADKCFDFQCALELPREVKESMITIGLV